MQDGFLNTTGWGAIRADSRLAVRQSLLDEQLTKVIPINRTIGKTINIFLKQRFNRNSIPQLYRIVNRIGVSREAT